MTRGAVAGIVVVMTIGLRADAAPKVPSKPGNRVAHVLAEAPYLLPPSPDGGRFSLVQFQVTAKGASVLGTPVPVEGSAWRFDRTLNNSRPTRPAYWILVRDPGTGEVVYWVPETNPRTRRIEREGRHSISGQAIGSSGGVISARVPFLPGKQVALFELKGSGQLPRPLAQLNVSPSPPAKPNNLTGKSLLDSGPWGPCDPVFCPQVYSIGPQSTYPDPFNVVFLPDGFNDDAGLELYRCAAKILVDELVHNEPWASFACRMSFYRLDLLAGRAPIEVASGCTDASCTVESVSPGTWMAACQDMNGNDTSLGTPTCDPTFPPSRVLSFDTQQCRYDICREVEPSDPNGIATAQRFAGCAPSPQAVVILANSSQRGGSGGVTSMPGQPGIAVITLDAMDSSNRWARLAHELGHVLGLLDEYTDFSGPRDYVCGENVYSPTLAAGANCTEDLASMWTCSPPPPVGTGPLGCRVICDDMSCADCQSVEVPAIGLYEGAFYERCGAYRSEERCMMRDYSSPMCGRCMSLLSEQLGGGDGCLAKGTQIAMEFDEKWKVQECPTRPIPPPPPPRIRPESPGVEPLPRGILLWPSDHVRGANPRAIVEKDGVIGEVGARKIVGKIRDLDRADVIHALEIQSVGPIGSKHLEWRRDGELLRPDTLEGNLIAKGLELGALVGSVTVVDDVRGATWTAKQVFWETTVGDVKPSSPSPR